MPAALPTLAARLAALLADEPTATEWPPHVEDLLDDLTHPTDTPFADSALLNAAPGAGTVLTVGAGSRVDSLTLPLAFTGIRTFSVVKRRTGTGTRIGRPVLTAQVRGDHCYLELELRMIRAPSGGGPDPDKPGDNEDAATD